MNGAMTENRLGERVLKRSHADIKATTTVLTVVGFLLAIVSSAFSISLAYDFITYSRSHHDNMSAKGYGDVDYAEKAQIRVVPSERQAFSTRTLRLQAISLSFLSVWLLAVLIPSTLFSRMGSAHLTIQGGSENSMPVLVDPVYWDYGFCECAVIVTTSFLHYRDSFTMCSEMLGSSTMVQLGIFDSG